MTPTLKIERMLISNFGSFVGKHVHDWDLGPALCFIAGENQASPDLGANGAGKSTLLTALFWCLYGRTLRNSRPGERIEPWHGSGTTSVELGIVVNGEEHKIYRSRKPNKLTLDDKVVTDTDLLKLLPDPEVVLYSFMLGQFNELFLDLKPEPQSQLFTDLLELDIWLRAVDRAGVAVRESEAVVRKCDLEIASLEGRLTQLEEAISTYTENARTFEDHRKKDLAELRERFEAISAQHIEAEAKTRDKPSLQSPLKLEQEVAKARHNSEQWYRVYNTKSAYLKTERELLVKADSSAIRISKSGLCPTCGHPLSKGDHKKLHAQFADTGADITQRIEKLIEERDGAIAEAASWSEEWKRLETELNAVRQTIEDQRVEWRDLERTITHLSMQRSDLQNNIKKLEGLPNHHETQLAQLLGQKLSLGANLVLQQSERKKAETVRDNAKLWQDGFRSIRLSIIEETLTEVTIAVTRHAERLGLHGWEIQFATERTTQKGTTALGFTANLFPPNSDKPIPFDSYSGGEVCRLQLAVSFGLGEVLLARAGISPNIEVYDEPTTGLSSEGISDLLECLHERSRETGRTVWVIDHHSLDRGSFDKSILVVKDAEGSHLVPQ